MMTADLTALMASDLEGDPLARKVLADALEEAGRVDEAELCRDEDTIFVRLELFAKSEHYFAVQLLAIDDAQVLWGGAKSTRDDAITLARREAITQRFFITSIEEVTK